MTRGRQRSGAKGMEAVWLELAIDALATYRLTRLATADVISEPARRAVLRRTGTEVGPDQDDLSAVEVVEGLKDPPRLATLVTCRWCAGIWIAAAVTTARLVAPRSWQPASRGLALSAAAVLFARLEDP